MQSFLYSFKLKVDDISPDIIYWFIWIYCPYLSYVYMYLLKPFAMDGMWNKSVFKQSTTGLNLGFSFSKISCLTRLKNIICSTIYP